MSDPEYTSALATNFVRSQQRVDTLHDQIVEAKKHRDIDMEKLAKRIAPLDMKDGEQIGVWANTNSDEEHCFVVIFKRDTYHVSKRGARDVTK